MKRYITFIAALMFGYLIGAFACWDINAGNWLTEVRTFVAFMSVCVGVVIATEV